MDFRLASETDGSIIDHQEALRSRHRHVEQSALFCDFVRLSAPIRRKSAALDCQSVLSRGQREMIDRLG